MAHSTITRPQTYRPDRTNLQRHAEHALAQHPFQVELRGSPGSLAWPAVCASCGAAAAERIKVRKVFPRPRYRGRRRRVGMATYAIASARIPFCAACAERHRELVPRRSSASRMVGVLLTPLLIPVVGSAYFGNVVLRSALEVPPGDAGFGIAWGLTALFTVILLWSAFAAWHATRPGRVEPQTDITRACDFSDDVGQLFEGERRIYAMRDATFADAFYAANRDRLWTAADDARSSRRFAAALAVAGVAALAVWLWVVLGP